jgi:anti-anti-sigma factor
MPDQLDIEVERRGTDAGQVAIIRVVGEVDLSNSERLAEALESDGDERAGIVLDLSEVPFMDSSGLRVLLMAANDDRPPLVAVLPPDSSVGRLFDLAEVADRLPSFASEDEALGALPASGADRGS